MDPALASLLETLQGKLRDIVSKSATFAATTTDEEGTYTSELEDAKRAILTCDKNGQRMVPERTRAHARVDDVRGRQEGVVEHTRRRRGFLPSLVLEAKEKLHRAVETLDQKPST
jgi:hypothetical protein